MLVFVLVSAFCQQTFQIPLKHYSELQALSVPITTEFKETEIHFCWEINKYDEIIRILEKDPNIRYKFIEKPDFSRNYYVFLFGEASTYSTTLDVDSVEVTKILKQSGSYKNVTVFGTLRKTRPNYQRPVSHWTLKLIPKTEIGDEKMSVTLILDTIETRIYDDKRGRLFDDNKTRSKQVHKDKTN